MDGDLFSFGEEEEKALKAQEKEDKRILEEKGFSRSKNCILDNTKLRKLGWNGKFTLRDGLTETLAYLKDE